jgi:outer membrane protein TolC
MKARTGTLIYCLLLTFSLTGQQALTLGECLGHVRHAHPASRQLSITDEIVTQELKINTASLLPQLNLNGKASWQTDVTSIDVPLPGVEIPSPDHDQYNFTADLVQPIYQGGAIRARRAVITQEGALSTLEERAEIQSSEEMAITLFFQIELQKQLVRTQALLIDQLNSIIDNLELSLSAGLTDKQSLLEAHNARRDADQKRSEALRLQALAKNSLGILMDLDTAAFQVLATPLESPSSATQAGFDGRVELQIVKARSALIEATEQYNKSQYNPRLALFATVGYGKPGLNFLETSFDLYLVAGATLTVPLSHFYSGKSSKEHQLFMLQRDQLDASEETVYRNLKLRSMQYEAEIQNLESRLRQDAESIGNHTEIVRLAELKHGSGLISTTDYLKYLTELSLARENKLMHETLLLRARTLLDHLHGSQKVVNQ